MAALIAFSNAAWLGLFALIAALGVITLVGVTLLSRPNREIMAGIGSLKIQLGADESNRRNDMTVASKLSTEVFDARKTSSDQTVTIIRS